MSADKLCLLVSRRCNLRCGFCRVNFTGMDMSWQTAKAGIEHYLHGLSPGAVPRIKFFGGEPLLNAALIREIVDAGLGIWRERGLRFEVSTNGLLLDAELLNYFRRHREVEVTVSQWAPLAASLPGVWFTVVIERNTRPVDFLSHLNRLWKAGFRGFNFLPVFYEPWTERELGQLRLSLAVAERFFSGLCKRGFHPRIKNLEVWSPVPLYNDALTLDVDGKFYASNLIQCEGMEPYHEILRLGDIGQPIGFLKRVNRPPASTLSDILSRWAGPSKWESTLKADATVTEFVNNLNRYPDFSRNYWIAQKTTVLV